MRVVSAALQTAIELRERVIRHQVTCDWDSDGVVIDGSGRVSDVMDDLTKRMSLVAVEQSLDSQLPAPVRIVPGAAVAELGVDIERGNIARVDATPTFRDATSATSGATDSATISVQRPPSAQLGDLMLMLIATSNASNIIATPTKSNVVWGELGLRGDTVFPNKVNGYLLARRVGLNEPTTYTVTLAGDGNNYVALPLCVANAQIAGIHALTSKGQDGNDTSSTIVEGRPIRTRLNNCMMVSFFAASASVTGGGTWTALDGDTKRAEGSTTSVSQANVFACVTTHDGVSPGLYTKRAQLPFAVVPTVVFSLALAPMIAADESQHAAWTFSEINHSSPYDGKVRTGRRMNWDVGLYTESGFETVRVFTGLSLTSDGQSRARSFDVRALDNRETLRTSVLDFLPTVMAQDPEPGFLTGDTNYPGLDATFIVSYTASHGLQDGVGASQFGNLVGVGYYASPPERQGGATILWVPCHGSLAGFTGFTDYAYTLSPFVGRRRVKFFDGPYVAGTEPAPPNGGNITAGWHTGGSSSVWMTNGQIKGRIEYMCRLSPAASGTVSVGAVDSFSTPLDKYFYLEITAAGQLQVRLAMATVPVTRTVAGPAAVVDDAWHFYGAHVDSVAGQVTFRVDNTSTVVAFATWANTVPVNVDDAKVLMTNTSNARIAEIHVCGGRSLSFGSYGYVVAATPWINENFVPNAYIDRSDLVLDTIPPIDYAYDDVWGMLSDIAAAEGAAVYFDTVDFYYRNSRSDVSPIGQTAITALTARTHLKDLRYVAGVAQIANTVVVPYTPFEARIGQVMWQPTGAIRVPASGTLTVGFIIDGYIFTIQNFNAFTSNTSPDGSGIVHASGDVTWTVSARGNTGAEITFENLTPVDLWLVDVNGSPTPQLTGSWMAIATTAAAPVVLDDDDSIRTYRTQSLAVNSSLWRQREDVARMFATRLISDLKDPHPTIQEMPVRGDPRRQLGDLAPVQDVNGLGVNGRYRITGITHSGTPDGGYEQSLTVREATAVAYWDTNYWNDGTVWGVVS